LLKRGRRGLGTGTGVTPRLHLHQPASRPCTGHCGQRHGGYADVVIGAGEVCGPLGVSTTICGDTG
ncbi:hypothetical protein, partial [Streptomyces albipurpureus]